MANVVSASLDDDEYQFYKDHKLSSTTILRGHIRRLMSTDPTILEARIAEKEGEILQIQGKLTQILREKQQKREKELPILRKILQIWGAYFRKWPQEQALTYARDAINTRQYRDMLDGIGWTPNGFEGWAREEMEKAKERKRKKKENGK